MNNQMSTKKAKKARGDKVCVITHGGCGSVPPRQHAQRNAICQRAADAAYEIMRKGGSSLDAVERAIWIMEDSGVLNAGSRGAFLQADGVPRGDASIMTDDRKAGAVIQVPWLRNPIRLARYVLDKQAHVMLSGREALELGLRLGYDVEIGAAPAKVEYWQKNMNAGCRSLDYAVMAKQWRESHRNRVGTVGAVARDSKGRICAATSTGGMGQCYPGRVGDSPIIGAGTYCTSQVGTSMTGTGEPIAVLLSAKTLCDHVARGMALDAAAQSVLRDLAAFGNGSAGLIALDDSGRMVAVKNTAFMAVGRRPKVNLS